MTIQHIPAHRIRPGQRVGNDRTMFNPEKLQALADSIRENGLQQPIVVRAFCSDAECAVPLHPDRTTCPACGNSEPVYEIVAGERRFRACLLIPLAEIECIVRGLDDERASAVMLTENTGRDDLDPVDEAFAYERRAQEYGWDDKQIAKKAGRNTDHVRGRRRLTKVRPDILKLVRSGNFPVGHAESLAELDLNRQMLAARPLIEGKRLNRREFQQVVDRLLAEQQQESLFDLQAIAVTPTGAPRVSTPIIPTLPELPALDVLVSGTGPTLVRYIETLLSAGREHEARVVGSVLMGLVKGNCARLPIITA